MRPGIIFPLFKTLLFTLLLPGASAVYAPAWLLYNRPDPFALNPGWLRFLGLLPLIAGVLIYLRCAWDFSVTGRGTPLPADPPKTVVHVGLYRFTRNPMYVGIITLQLGEALLFQSWAVLRFAAGTFILVHLFILLYEEPNLRRRFGGTYREYCAHVPRWLPRLHPYRPLAVPAGGSANE